MYRIFDESVARWGKAAGRKVPHCVDTICPFCGRPMSFPLNAWQEARPVNAMCLASRCTACKKSPNFLWIYGPEQHESQSATAGLFMWPTPRLIRQPIAGLEVMSDFPEALSPACASAIRTFNVREWIGCAVLCGRLLEGLVKTLLPDDVEVRTVAEGLKQLPKHVKLDEPLIKLADGIRRGRNIGAHFDSKKEPDEDTTEMMLDLLDYLIEYLFILPDRVNRLHDRLAEQ